MVLFYVIWQQLVTVSSVRKGCLGLAECCLEPCYLIKPVLSLASAEQRPIMCNTGRRKGWQLKIAHVLMILHPSCFSRDQAEEWIQCHIISTLHSSSSLTDLCYPRTLLPTTPGNVCLELLHISLTFFHMDTVKVYTSQNSLGASLTIISVDNFTWIL